VLYYLIFAGGSLPTLRQAAEAFGAPDAVGLALFTQFLLPFEVISVLLLVARLGAIILSKPRPVERR
jgi:NADH-quinone oxidoreductase subunit J